MCLSKDIAEKSVQAAIASIEIYNKPDFAFREEAFSLLMTNAWELLLKAKWLADHNENIESLYEIGNDGKPRMSRSGNNCTHSLTYLAKKLFEDKNSGFDMPTFNNVNALIEIRDNSAHFINKDILLGLRVLEIGTASLQNYLQLIGDWFQIDLSRYNFFLMPLSFYHGFEATTLSISPRPVQMQRLLDYLDALESADDYQGSRHVAIRLQTHFIKSRDNSAIPFKLTNDPNAPTVQLTEVDVFLKFSLTYKQLTDKLRCRYINFVKNHDYHRLLRELEQSKDFTITRALDYRNPKSAKQKFYNPSIIQEFDKYYQLCKKGTTEETVDGVFPVLPPFSPKD